MIASPIYSRDEQAARHHRRGAAMGCRPTMSNTLALMAAKRRLFVLPQLYRAARAHRRRKGEVTAEVTSATVLTKAQADALAKTLKARSARPSS
jgi:F-type H+-transporting ATPase subunit delta